ncbi:MAG: hypothetical protein ACM3SY_10865 [Candidatus Omnitrophota bacterium]
MPVISANLSEALIKATLVRDIDEAFNRVFTEFLDLKLNQLDLIISRFQKKWNSTFEEFKKNVKENQLKEDPHSYSVENDFWQWEEAVTLKEHYDDIKKQWV